MNKYPVTIDTARRALSCLDASDTALWVKCGMALKSEYGEEAFSLWDEWSATAANYDANACKTRWKSFKTGGRVGIGSLIHEAKQRGFDPKAEASNAPASMLTPEALAQREAERKAQAEREAEATGKAHNRAQNEAQRIWNQAIAHAPSLYLERKQVKAHGVRFERAGSAYNVIVPVRDGAGVLWNLQRIQPDGMKLFLKGGRKSGLWHMIGGVNDAVVNNAGTVEVDTLLVAEGYATAATLHEATGYPVAVAFDAGNLAPVCLALRQSYPSARMLICADNDTQTEAKTGHNTGVEAAHKAAALVGAMVCIPEGLAADESDFNDLGVRLGDTGFEAVKAQIEACLAAFVPAPAPSSTPSPAQAEPTHTDAIPIEAYAEAANVSPSDTSAEPQESPLRTPKGEAKANASDEAKSGVASAGRGSNGRFVGGSHFTCDGKGVWYHGLDNRGEAKKPQWVCTPLRVTAKVRDEHGHGWGLLLEFSDPLCAPKKWVLPTRMLAGDGVAIRENLFDAGLEMSTSHEARQLLNRYIRDCSVYTYAFCTERVGWFKGAFVLPDWTIGEPEDERILLQSETIWRSPFKQSGALAEWIEHVAQPCAGNSRVVFAIACAFAGVLLEPTGVTSGGFHFVGESSIGKSTMLYVASSVFGSHKFMKTWYNTSTALEATASQYNDTLLVLDEIGQADVKDIGQVVYMFGNENGKGRSVRTARSVNPLLEWRLIYLSNGEKSLADIMDENGKTIKAGQETRLVNIRANVNEVDGGQGSIFERYSGAEGAAMSDRLKQVTRKYYGTAGVAFIEWLQPQLDTLRDTIRADIDRLTKEWTPAGAHGQVARVVQRFALVAVAGELATRAGVTGWKQGEAEVAAFMCFEDWLNERGGAGNSEEAKALAQVRAWFELHQNSRFEWWHRVMDDHSPKTSNMAGYKRLVDSEGKPAKTYKKEDGEWVENSDNCYMNWYVMREVFEQEICKGFKPKTVARLLLDRGVIEGSSGGKEFTVSRRLPASDRTQRCYLFKTAVIE